VNLAIDPLLRMMARGLLLTALALGLAVASPAAAQRAPGPADPAPTTRASNLPPPITFFLAHGDADACGPGCRDWIAAEGTIDTDADDRLHVFLSKLGGRKLPIFFHSPGGSVPAGLAIGRLMRDHHLTAGVGLTVPAGCDASQRREPACDKLKRSGRELIATLDTGHAMCNSSCVYAIVGAAVREIGAGVQLGVHSSSISYTLSHVDEDGHVTREPTHVPPAAERRALERGYEKIGAYLKEMGISAGLLAAARDVENSKLRFLTREQVVAFGIDRRDTVEGIWWFIDRSSSGPSALKVIEEYRAGAYRKDIMRLSCRNAGLLRFQYGRDAGTAPAGPPERLRVTTSAGSFLLGSPSRTNPSDGRRPLDVRSADLPISVLGEAAFTIEAADAALPAAVSSVPRGAVPHGDAPGARQSSGPSVTRVTVERTGPGLGELSRRCGMGGPARPDTAASERI
jgi:hypothetical protein